MSQVLASTLSPAQSKADRTGSKKPWALRMPSNKELWEVWIDLKGTNTAFVDRRKK